MNGHETRWIEYERSVCVCVGGFMIIFIVLIVYQIYTCYQTSISLEYFLNRQSYSNVFTHTHTHIHIFKYVYKCNNMCVCV